MATTIWSGSISFGLVAVPVKLTPATQSKDVTFNQLDSESGSRVRYKRMAEATGEVVDQSRIVKGYELSPGQYVMVEPDELKAMAPKASHTIEIEEFVDLDDIDPLFFENPYYLQPDPKALKPYRLLVEAMDELNKVAIGRIVMRTKESLVAIRSLDGMLVVETMRYADEVLPREISGDGEDIEVSDKERAMATQLIETLSEDWDPEKYEDSYREELLALIEKKAAGEEIVATAEPETPAEVVDLAKALEASLEKAESQDKRSA